MKKLAVLFRLDQPKEVLLLLAKSSLLVGLYGLVMVADRIDRWVNSLDQMALFITSVLFFTLVSLYFFGLSLAAFKAARPQAKRK